MSSITSFMTDHTALTILLSATALCVGVVLFLPNNLLKYLQRKRYQYEVTFSLYMMTPTEKFIFNSILFLFLAMVLIAASLYLPSHILTIGRRAYYYALGDVDAAAGVKNAGALVRNLTRGVDKVDQATGAVVSETATKIVEAVVEKSGGVVAGGGEL